MLLKANPEQWIWFIIAIFVAWRLTVLICYESGPFNIMSSARKFLYRIYMGKLIDCFHCTAVWVSLLITVLMYSVGISTVFLALGISGGASIIEKLILNRSNQTYTNEDDQ